MLILGVDETLQFIDGSDKLPVMQFLRALDEVIAFAAPAVAAGGDTILEMTDPRTQTRLRNRIRTEILEKSGLHAESPFVLNPPPIYQMLAFDAHAIGDFGAIRECAGEEIDFYDAQTFAIALSQDAVLALLDNRENRDKTKLLSTCGLTLDVRWIPNRWE